MATNCELDEVSATDTEMAESDTEQVVTMMDVLKQQQEFEDDANAVLGASDEKECTYSRGYIKRQAIYACMSCCPESKDDPSKRAGFCLACSLNCHENHDLVELYTKRNFRCDCGNQNFKTPCQFTPSKSELNHDNVYNQNFIGLYCICSTPYPDTTCNEDMIQCIVCEDWWHASHLDAVVPANDQFAEMICKLCMAKNEFLHDYSGLAVECGEVDVVKVNGDEGTETDDHNNSLTEGKLTNGSATKEKLTNGIEEVMETDAADALKDAIPKSIEHTQIESKDSDKLQDTAIQPEKLQISAESMDTEQTDNAAELIPETSSDDKLDIITKTEACESLEEKADSTAPDEETKQFTANAVETQEEISAISEDNKEESNTTSEDKTEESNKTSEEKTEESNSISDEKTEESNTTSEEKTEESNTTSEEKTEEYNVTSEEKAEESSVTSGLKTEVGEQIEDSASGKITAGVIDEKTDNVDESGPKEHDESSAAADSETANAVAENPTKIIDSEMNEDENKVTKDQEIKGNAEKEQIDINKSSDGETDKPGAETNENPTEETKGAETMASETSQDKEVSEISKETSDEIVSEDSSAKDTTKVNEVENNDHKQSSTNEIESKSNENKVPEISSTENKRKMSIADNTDNISVKKPKLDDSKCLRPKGIKRIHKGATFWTPTFRQKLCTCNECISMYKDLSVLFLIDMDDTVCAYERLGIERTAGKPNQYEKGLEALCSLGRIQQIDALTEYNKMRDKLINYLRSFKEKKEIVTENDIKSFFAGMKPEKRTDGVYFCG